MKNDSDGAGKKDKKISRIKDQLSKLRAKLNASENQQPPLPSKSNPKKIKFETEQAEGERYSRNLRAGNNRKKAKEAKEKKARRKEEPKKEAKEKKARRKEEAKKKEKEAKEK